MKTDWSSRYLGKMSGREQHTWRRSKVKEFEAKTNWRWSTWESGGKRRFRPMLDWKKGESRDQALRDDLIGRMRDIKATHHWSAVDMLDIAEAVGGELNEVGPVLLGLVKDGIIRCQVNRMGDGVWFHLV